MEATAERYIRKELRQTFFTDLEQCRRVDLDDWRKRGPWRRVGERFASLLQDKV